MSSRVSDLHGGDQAGEGAGFVQTFIRHALDEVEKQRSSQNKDSAQQDKPALKADEIKQFGDLTIVDKATDARGDKSEKSDKVGDAPATPGKNTGEVATQISSRAEFQLQDSHKGKKYTFTGTAPQELAYNDSFAVKFDQSPALVAMLQLGPNATTEQRDKFAKVLETLNKDKLTDDGHGNKIFATGATIKLPGQTKDGGLTYRTADGNTTEWNDGSTLVRKDNGSGSATFKHEGKDVTATWDRHKPENNKWNGEISLDLLVVNFRHQRESTYDKQGNIIEKTYGVDEKVPIKITVTDRSHSISELTPGDDGEYHGTKKHKGTVIDSDVGMTADGRFYSRSKDADGNTVKKFDSSTETYDAGGKLIAKTEQDSEKGAVTSTFKDGKLQSVSFEDKDKNLYELKPDKTGELVGVKKDSSGNVVDQVGMHDLESKMYSRKETRAGVEKTYADGSVVKTDRDGDVVEVNRKDSHGRQMVEKFKGDDMTVTIRDTDNSVITLKTGKDGALHGEKKDAAGRVIEKNLGMDSNGDIYKESTAAGITSRVYEDGRTQKTDAGGKIVEQSGKDNIGREFTNYFNPADGQKTRIDMKINPGDPPVDFHRTADGKYVHEYKSSTGETVRTVELQPGDGTLVYKNIATEAKLTVRADGSTESESKEASGNLRRVRMKNGDMVSTEVSKDASGAEHVLRQTFIDPNGTIFENKYKNDELTSVTIHKKDGIVVLEKQADNKWLGTKTDWFGNKEDAIMFPGRSIMYKDRDTGAVREEKISWKAGHLVPSLDDANYDANTGTFANGSSSAKTVESRSPGRVDVVGTDGSISGMTITGDISYQKGTGDAGIVHPTLEGARITADGKIETWSKDGSKTDTLTDKEAAFLKDHPDTDRRNLLEIHRRYQGDRAKIDAFYTQLARVEDIDHLSSNEKAALVKTMMHHVAFPAEIYQGASPTCNVSVIQRDLAITSPEKYANFVMNALDRGYIWTADGRKVNLDVDNLKMQDFSGRDITTRIFQTATLNVLRYPDQIFENTADGTGKWHENIQYFGLDVRTGDTAPMTGLTMPEIAKIRHAITGEEKAQIGIHSTAELVALFKQNGSKPMTIAVDASTYPFAGAGPISGGFGGHVVTITGIEEGTPMRFYVQNQWGLQNDHSNITSLIEGEDVLNNMMRFGGGKAGLIIGDAPSHKKAYNATTNADGTVTVK